MSVNSVFKEISSEIKVNIDGSRDDLLTDFAKNTLKDRYLAEGESYQNMFARVARYYASFNVKFGASFQEASGFAQKIYDYMSKLWFMPATPVLSNAGINRVLPISCFLNEVEDSLVGIRNAWDENMWMASKGGGIGTYWGGVRPINDAVFGGGVTSGIIPFIKVQEAMSMAISQGGRRRGSSAVYLDVSHPEIIEFVDLRRATGADHARRANNLHHGIVIPDAFMNAVIDGASWELINPRDGNAILVVDARDLWIRILNARIETGEPYLLFIDNILRHLPDVYDKAGLTVKTSNLCSEITLHTGLDYNNKPRTAVCCLSSLNLETFDEWRDDKDFVHNILLFLDNVLEDFIESSSDDFSRARYSASMERSVGMGVMGFHSFLQSKNISIESALAKSWNKKIFSQIHRDAELASQNIAEERGPCPDAERGGVKRRFANTMAIAPTASISIVASNTSPGIEPYVANIYMHKTLGGSISVKNKNLEILLESLGKNTEEVWLSIMMSEGSVAHLDFLTDDQKAVFKTAFEINQLQLVDLQADRTPYISQSTSFNIFIRPNEEKKKINDIHLFAWQRGLKSMYYTRSLSTGRAEQVSKNRINNNDRQMEIDLSSGLNPNISGKTSDMSDGEECLACQ